ncbi:MAG: FG-GAP-like repeat-containing protein [Pirellulaceae bacterium]
MDFDGDGDHDIISGDWLARVILFRRTADGSFSAGEPVKDGQGRIIRIDGYGTYVYAVDWDADGDLDVLAGTNDVMGEGSVWLVQNGGSRDKPAFGKPETLTAEGQVICVPEGNAAPVATDWDGDGQLDLVVGAGDGSVLWHRNIGSAQQPDLAAAQTLIPPPAQGSPRGDHARICVVDFNGDGRDDILLGDCGDQFEKTLSDEEVRWREEAREQQARMLRSWAGVFREYRALLGSPLPEQEDARRQREQELARLRRELQRQSAIRNKYYREEQALDAGMQRHGRVWLFLRKGD